MASFIVEGNHPLHGEITPQGAKNEALQVICASLLTTEEVVIENVPDILEARFPKLNGKVLINNVGNLIGSHTGPGTVALFFWGSERVD